MQAGQRRDYTGSGRRSAILALLIMGVTTQPFFAKDTGKRLLRDSITAGNSDGRAVQTEIEDLHPFTHLASIPADSDPSSIRFEKVKAAKVFTERKVTTDPGYCDDLQFRDPGGSMYCPSVREASPALAYEVTYSYKSQPMASDEYGNRNFTFRVYFRPEELPQGLRTALSTGKIERAEVASYFDITTSRLMVSAAAIDETKSIFCDGNYMDGNWIQTDQKCRDKISLKPVTMPSDYIAIDVKPISPRTQQAAVHN